VAAERCPRCGRPLPAGANFCPNCGAPVSVPEASERRIVTVVFVDMAGSTELASQVDAERFREILAAFHGMVSEEAAWLGGVAEGFIGDAVLVVFGIPAAREDDAIRAIRTAIDIRDRAERLGEELGLSNPIRVRIGVRTGQVAVGTAQDRNIVIGAEVNLGARLQQAAAPGEILVGDTTMQLARDGVAFGEPRTIEAKGFEGAVTAWRSRGCSRGPSTAGTSASSTAAGRSHCSTTCSIVPPRGSAHTSSRSSASRASASRGWSTNSSRACRRRRRC